MIRPMTIPKYLLGAVQKQFVKCSTPNCRCRKGQPHGPYYYRFWREDGRLRKEYVKPADLAAVQAACALWRESRKSEAVAMELWRDLCKRFAETLPDGDNNEASNQQIIQPVVRGSGDTGTVSR